MDQRVCDRLAHRRVGELSHSKAEQPNLHLLLRVVRLDGGGQLHHGGEQWHSLDPIHPDCEVLNHLECHLVGRHEPTESITMAEQQQRRQGQ